MKKIFSYSTPLKFATIYILIATVWLAIANADDPSTRGWAFLFDVGMIFAAAVLLIADYCLIRYLKNTTVFWAVQLLLSFACVWIFIKAGLPGRL